MLADLLNEKKEVSGMKQMNRRRIPAAAFVAAVLVIALAGTALAYFSRVTVAPYGDEGGYSVRAETGNVPLSELSEDVLHGPQKPALAGNCYPSSPGRKRRNIWDWTLRTTPDWSRWKRACVP